MLRPALLICLALLAAPAAAIAQSQADLTKAAAGKKEDADIRLTAVTFRLSVVYSAGQTAAMQAAQSAWVQYRDKECAFEGMSSAAGDVHTMIVDNCAARMAEQRIKELQHQDACQSGDPTCLLPPTGVSP